MSAVIKLSLFLILWVIVSSSAILQYRLSNVNPGHFKEVGKCHQRACLPNERGGIIPHVSKEYQVIASNVKVYRIFTHPVTQGKAMKFSSWWTLRAPSGSKSKYMKEHAICPEYNNMTHLVVCVLRKGVRVSIGPTQSVRCADGNVIKANNKAMQIFINSAFGKDDKTIIGRYGPFKRCKPVRKSPLK